MPVNLALGAYIYKTAVARGLAKRRRNIRSGAPAARDPFHPEDRAYIYADRSRNVMRLLLFFYLHSTLLCADRLRLRVAF